MVVEKTDGATLLPIISQFVEQGSTVMTDELNSYNGLVANGYKHEYVKHKESQFSFGDEHLQAYIDEACFRWNTRKASQVERFLDMFFMSIGLVRPNREFVLCKDD